MIWCSRFARLMTGFILLFGLNTIVLRAGENTLLRLNQMRLIRLPEKESIQPQAATVALTETGGVELSVKGAGRARAHWLIPVNCRLPVTGSLQFSVSTTNLTAPGGRPNIYMVLRRLPDKIGKQLIQVPVFTALAADAKELGRANFSIKEGTHYLHSIHIDMHLADTGEGKFLLNDLQLSFQGNLKSQEELETTLKRQPGSKARTDPAKNGSVRLVVNDAPLPTAMGVAVTPEMAFKNLGRQAETSGLVFNRLSVPLGGSKSIWSHQGYFDETRLRQLLESSCPGGKAFLILELRLEQPPDWWVQSLPKDAKASARIISDFNPHWQAYCEAAIRQTLAAVRQSPWDRWVIGVMLNLGPHRNLMALPHRDQHPGYGLAFRNWLKARYKTDAELQKAWRDPQVSLATAAPKSPNAWPSARFGLLRHPGKGAGDVDSLAFRNISWLQHHLNLCRLVKKWTSNQYICGISNGPAAFMNELWPAMHSWSYGALAPLLKAPEVDFVEVDLADEDLRLGKGTLGNEMLLARAMRDQGKLFVVRATAPLGQSKEPERLRTERLRRLLVHAAANQAALLFASCTSADLALPWVQNELARFRSFSPAAKMSKAEVAFVIDPDLFGDLMSREDLLTAPAHARSTRPRRPTDRPSPLLYLLALPRHHWQRLGTPFDVVFVDDLKPGKYRMVVFYHTIRFTPARQKLVKKLQSGRTTLVWLWADALRHGDELAPAAASGVIGMNVTASGQAKRFFLKPTDELGKALEVSGFSEHFGAHVYHGAKSDSAVTRFAPSFQVTAPKAQVLARFSDSAEPALAIRKMQDWTDVYSASPTLNSELLRALAKNAGVHLYLEANDQVFFGPGLIALHTGKAGRRFLQFKAKQALYEVFYDRDLKPSLRQAVDIEADSTYMFFLGTKAQWQTLNKTTKKK